MVPVREATFLLFFSSRGGGSGRGCFSFSDFWSFRADDQGRGVAVASAALSGDLKRLKDIFESDDCSILPDVLEHWTLRKSMWS